MKNLYIGKNPEQPNMFKCSCDQFNEAKALISSHDWEAIHIDYELSDDDPDLNGYELLLILERLLKDKVREPPESIVVDSDDPVMVKKMANVVYNINVPR